MKFFVFIFLFIQINLFPEVFSLGEKSISLNVSYNKIPFSIDVEKNSSIFYKATNTTTTFKNNINLKGDSKFLNYIVNFNFSYIDCILSLRAILPHKEKVYYNNEIILDNKLYGLGFRVYKIIEGDSFFLPQVSISSYVDFLNSDNFKKVFLDIKISIFKIVKKVPFYLSFSYPTVFYFVKEDKWYDGNISFFLIETGVKIIKKDFALSLSDGFGINSNIFNFSISYFL